MFNCKGLFGFKDNTSASFENAVFASDGDYAAYVKDKNLNEGIVVGKISDTTTFCDGYTSDLDFQNQSAGVKTIAVPYRVTSLSVIGTKVAALAFDGHLMIADYTSGKIANVVATTASEGAEVFWINETEILISSSNGIVIIDASFGASNARVEPMSFNSRFKNIYIKGDNIYRFSDSENTYEVDKFTNNSGVFSREAIFAYSKEDAKTIFKAVDFSDLKGMFESEETFIYFLTTKKLYCYNMSTLALVFEASLDKTTYRATDNLMKPCVDFSLNEKCFTYISSAGDVVKRHNLCYGMPNVKTEVVPNTEIARYIPGDFLASKIELSTLNGLYTKVKHNGPGYVYSIGDVGFKKLPVIVPSGKLIDELETITMADEIDDGSCSSKTDAVMKRLLRTTKEIKKFDIENSRSDAYVSDQDNYFSLNENGVMINNKLFLFREIFKISMPALKLNSNKEAIGLYVDFVDTTINDINTYVTAFAEKMKAVLSASSYKITELNITFDVSSSADKNVSRDTLSSYAAEEYIFNTAPAKVVADTVVLEHDLTKVSIFKLIVLYLKKHLDFEAGCYDAKVFSPSIKFNSSVDEDVKNEIKIFLQDIFENYLPCMYKKLTVEDATGIFLDLEEV